MEKRLLRVGCSVCMAFAFVLIGLESLRIMDWVSMLVIVGFGLIILSATFYQPSVRARLWSVIVKIAVVGWSLWVYIIFVVVASTSNLSAHSAPAPAWMAVSASYVFACVPLIILWIPRLTLREFQD